LNNPKPTSVIAQQLTPASGLKSLQAWGSSWRSRAGSPAAVTAAAAAAAGLDLDLEEQKHQKILSERTGGQIFCGETVKDGMLLILVLSFASQRLQFGKDSSDL